MLDNSQRASETMLTTLEVTRDPRLPNSVVKHGDYQLLTYSCWMTDM